MRDAHSPIRIVVVLFVVLAGIQLIPVDRRNPAADPSHAIYATEPMPAEVKAVFERSCNDCHSSQTRWPWYSRVAPVSWIVAHDVHEARKQMNFSEWSTYPQKRRDQKLEAICEQLMNGDMPDGKYALIHRSARPTQQQREAVCTWVDSMR